MAAMFGYGVIGDAAVVEPATDGMHFKITTYGGPPSKVMGWTSSPKIDSAAHTEAGQRGATAREPLVDSPKTEIPQPPDAVEGVASKVQGHVHRLLTAPKVLELDVQTGTYRSGTYREFEVYASRGFVIPNTTQIPTIYVGYKVELIAAGAPMDKFIVVSNLGTGVNPGPLNTNDIWNRGYFQDEVDVQVSPGGSAAVPYMHTPNTASASNTFSATSGCSFGLNAGAPGASAGTFSCGQQNSTSVTLPDFSPIDQSTGAVSLWQYKMTSTSVGPYYDPTSLIDQSFLTNGQLGPLPQLATSTLVPAFETIYKVDPAYNGPVQLSLSATQDLAGIWVTDYGAFDVPHVQRYSQSATQSAYCDMSLVSAIDYYTTIIGKNGGFNFDVYYSQTTPGTNVVQWPATGNNNQTFDLIQSGPGGGFFMKPKHTMTVSPNGGLTGGLCLGASSVAAGANLEQLTCTGDASQQFVFVDTGAGVSTDGTSYWKLIQLEGTNLCLSGDGHQINPVVFAPCNASLDAQLFHLQ
jgi:hypothetical protein